MDARDQHLLNIELKIKNDSKCFWNYLNGFKDKPSDNFCLLIEEQLEDKPHLLLMNLPNFLKVSTSLSLDSGNVSDYNLNHLGNDCKILSDFFL